MRARLCVGVGYVDGAGAASGIGRGGDDDDDSPQIVDTGAHVSLLGKSFATVSGDEPSSGLIREHEDDEDAEAFDDNDGRRINMANLLHKGRRSHMPSNLSLARPSSDDAYEMEQIRRSSKRGAAVLADATADERREYGRQAQSGGGGALPLLAIGSAGSGGAGAGANADGTRVYEAVTVDTIRQSLQRSLLEMRDMSSRRAADLAKLEMEVASSAETETRLEAKMAKVNEKVHAARAARLASVAVYCECSYVRALLSLLMMCFFAQLELFVR